MNSFINIDDIVYSLRDSLKINLMNYIDTGFPVFDHLFKMLIMILLTSLSSRVFYSIINFKFNIDFNLKNLFKTKKSLKIRGKSIIEMQYMHSHFDFSLRFTAIMELIIKSLKEIPENRNLITNITELLVRETTKYNDDGYRTGSDQENGFIVDQKRCFKLEDNIFCNIISFKDNIEGEKKAPITKVEYEITIWSYELSCFELHQYVEKITDSYEKGKKKESEKSRYIFKFDGVEKQDRRGHIRWQVNEFQSTTTLDCLFFEGKDKVIEILSNFINERHLYEKLGKPWQLGILLEGEPGCGKTSFIKAIANYFNRSIKDLQFNRMNTIDDLEGCINCIEYDNKNMQMNNVIMVAEDFDCMTNIARSRSLDAKDKEEAIKRLDKKRVETQEQINSMKSDEAKAIMFAISKEQEESEKFVMIGPPSKKGDREITLSSLLNILDGIYSYNGRIIIFSTNHPEVIDEACLRSGRIDLRINFKRATVDILYQMMSHWYKCYDEFYGKNLTILFEKYWIEYSDKFIDYRLKPCDITNLMQKYGKNTEEVFNKLIALQN